jgi:hypothetical protein
MKRFHRCVGEYLGMPLRAIDCKETLPQSSVNLTDHARVSSAPPKVRMYSGVATALSSSERGLNC